MKTHATIREHFIELKKRVLYTLSFFLVAFAASYAMSDYIIEILLRPLKAASIPPSHLIYTALTEAFFSYLNLAAEVALTVSLPFALWQFYNFLKPGLYKNERVIIRWVFNFFIVLFIAGVLFAYFIVVPKAWEFFLSYQRFEGSLNIVLEAKISEYISLISSLLFAFAFAFQVPNVLVILCLAGFISTQWLRDKRRLAIVVNFIIAGIITPPDIFSQIALAIPMILLYELSILICAKIEKGQSDARRKMD